MIHRESLGKWKKKVGVTIGMTVKGLGSIVVGPEPLTLSERQRRWMGRVKKKGKDPQNETPVMCVTRERPCDKGKERERVYNRRWGDSLKDKDPVKEVHSKRRGLEEEGTWGQTNPQVRHTIVHGGLKKNRNHLNRQKTERTIWFETFPSLTHVK